MVLPRELSIDEIRQMDEEAPEDMDFEMFVHGALCWCVSGRCYWSSYLGGKSGLRGRCVQPCRRIYKQKGREGRFFSCQDLSIDVLVKTLAEIPHIRSLKIEGRKKGPHYVYHVVTAYRMLLDSLGHARLAPCQEGRRSPPGNGAGPPRHPRALSAAEGRPHLHARRTHKFRSSGGQDSV